jgi:branched-chain amino acid transport system permease protein
MVVIGGLGTFWGPVLGGVIFTFLPEILRAIADYRMIIYGLLMTVSIIFMPEGLIGIFRSLRTKKLTE